MESTWNLSFHMESTWNPHGIYLSTWNPHGNGMEFMWNIPYGFLVEIPYGMVESTWTIGGKKSPKWVRSQPKQIPCGIGGQGKDLQYDVGLVPSTPFVDICQSVRRQYDGSFSLVRLASYTDFSTKGTARPVRFGSRTALPA